MNPLTSAAYADRGIPLHLDAPEDFSRVLCSLRRPDFDQNAVEGVLQDLGFRGLDSASPKKSSQQTPTDPLANSVLVKLFVRLERVSCSEVENALGTALRSFLSLGLIRQDSSDGCAYYSPVFLYPIQNLMIASDHHRQSGGLPPDSVFPAVEPGTAKFLKLLPERNLGDVLDLCSGTGIAALFLSKHARHVVASDVTDRATHFAQINRLLNGCSNVEVLQGDLYQSVEERTFDFIAAHTPLMPSLKIERIWRDAGPTGETFLNRIVEGLPRFLRPNGEFFSLCLGSDTEKDPFQYRVRKWLGQSQDEFDIISASDRYPAPPQLARAVAEQQGLLDDPAHVQQLERAFFDAGVKRFVYGALAIRRHGKQKRTPQTLRTQLSPRTNGRSFQWVFDWNAWSSSPDLVKQLANLRPSLAENLLVKVTHKVANCQLVPADHVMEIDWPFSHSARVDAGIVSLTARFNGKITVANLYAAARRERAIPEGYELGNFVSMIAMQIGRGHLTVSKSAVEDLLASGN